MDKKRYSYERFSGRGVPNLGTAFYIYDSHSFFEEPIAEAKDALSAQIIVDALNKQNNKAT